MATLTVPSPNLICDWVDTAVDPKLAMLEKPVQVRCPPVLLSDGTPLELWQQKVAGYFVYRQGAGAPEIWDETAKKWKPDPGVAIASFQPKPFAFKPGELNPWQSLLVPVAEKSPPFEVGGGFRYFFQAYFVSDENTGSVSGLSPPSSTIEFRKLQDTFRAGFQIKPFTDRLHQATEIEMFLKDSSYVVIGSVVIKTSGGSSEIKISNLNGAVVQLLPSGDIVLRPKAGGTVKVEGSLEAQSFNYPP